MIQASLVRLQSKLDDWRVFLHFKRVESLLRKRDVSDLPSNLQLARRRNLDCLHNYAVRAIFPRNHEQLGYSPCFIDRDRRECAVAHLIISSGQGELANEIAATANYAYVPQMNFPELDNWAAQTGLSKEELTLIQPGYWLTLNDLLPMLIPVWSLGLIIGLINLIQIRRGKRGCVMPLIGLVTSVGLLLVGMECFNEAIVAWGLGSNPDGYPYDLPLRDVKPLLLGVAISIVLLLLVVGISLHRILGGADVKDKNT